MMIEEELLREMRLQNAILKAAFGDRIEALARKVEEDAVSRAIVEVLRERGRTAAGELKEAVAERLPQGADASRRTMSRRLADLENKGVVEQIGQGRTVDYQLTGLIG